MKPIDRLLEIMARLRNKENGCPWDVEQNFASIAPHTLEEAYEVVDAIDRKDMQGLREELGDLLLTGNIPRADGGRTERIHL